MHRWTRIVGSALGALLVVSASASAGAGGGAAAPPTPVTAVLARQTMSGAPVPCTARPDGIRVCHGDVGGPGGADLRLKSFDGTPLALYVTLPAAPASGPDGGYPLVVQSHGWGAAPTGPDDRQYGGPTAAEWAGAGYAVVQLAARGWGNSCGTEASRLVSPDACAKGYLRLGDFRYEARDVQHGIGLLVDEGVADAGRIGLTGESYGAGVSLALATLRDRVMDADGSVHPWTSPAGTPIRVAAAAPVSGWSDLGYALMPNGRTRDSQVTTLHDDFSPLGVWKSSIDAGLFLVGEIGAYYAPAGTDPQADVRSWFATMGAGEPYDAAVTDPIVDTIARFRSPYYMLAGTFGVEKQAPAPLLIAAGFTDAVFPVDESLRYYNLERELYPANPIGLYLYDGGHQRGQNKPADGVLLVGRIKAFFDHYVRGAGPPPPLGVTALTQTCPATAPSGGPYDAATWRALHPGEVRFASGPTQTISSTAGDPALGKAFDPVTGGLACTTAPAADQGAGVATYRLPAATGSGYTLLGAPTVTADVAVTGTYAYVAARLLDVDPVTNTEVLVARGEYRIDPNRTDVPVTFQLHPNAWHFAPGHVAKLELLGQDAPYLRPSNGNFSVAVSNLGLALPVHDVPGAPGTAPEVQAFRAVKAADGSDGGSDGFPVAGVVVLVVVIALVVALVVRALRSRRRRSRDGLAE